GDPQPGLDPGIGPRPGAEFGRHIHVGIRSDRDPAAGGDQLLYVATFRRKLRIELQLAAPSRIGGLRRAAGLARLGLVPRRRALLLVEMAGPRLCGEHARDHRADHAALLDLADEIVGQLAWAVHGLRMLDEVGPGLARLAQA